jgi:hypothetical protein
MDRLGGNKSGTPSWREMIRAETMQLTLHWAFVFDNEAHK